MIVNQPRNYSNDNMSLRWNPSFASSHSENLHEAQCFVDSECIRYMKPYTPFRNGILEHSATLGTVIGSGKIQQITPYARYQYYGRLNHDTSRHPHASRMWFEVMKAEKKQVILRGACRIAGGTPR